MTTTLIPIGTPYKESYSIANAKKVLDAVGQRFPDWAAQCEPYVNVLTLRAWNLRGYRVKKGEKAIRVAALIPVWKEDKETGEKVQVGTRGGTAYVFAMPQVEMSERRPRHPHEVYVGGKHLCSKCGTDLDDQDCTCP